MAKGRIFLKKKRKSATGFSLQKSANIQDIQTRAYHIWESKGRPENNALDNWLEAERSFK